MNEEPIRITEKDLSDAEGDRLLRLKEALEGDDFGKTEVNLKYGDRKNWRSYQNEYDIRTCKDHRLWQMSYKQQWES